MKITGPFLDPAKKGQPKPWYLRIVTAKKNPDGTLVLSAKGRVVLARRRPYYDSRKAAEADKPALAAQHGAAGAEIAGGILTREQASEFAEAKALVPEVSLPEIARFWRRHHPLESVARCSALTEPFLKEVEARLGEGRTHSDLSSRLNAFTRAFGDRIPATLTRNELTAWLLSLARPVDQGGAESSGRTVLNYKRAAVTFLNWLVERGHLSVNPIAGMKRRQLPRVEKKEIAFLGLDEARDYLRACERYDPDLVAHEIVQLFAGVRSDDEMADFDGRWVLPATREVVIPAEIAKTGRREVIATLEENFWAWWASYGRKGLLRVKNHRKRWKRLRLLATLPRAEADRLAAAPLDAILRADRLPEALRSWPWNARRRTFCTYHVAKHQSADKTALILRHRGEAYTLHNSYRGLGVTQAQGVEYFAILPENVATPIRWRNNSLAAASDAG